MKLPSILKKKIFQIISNIKHNEPIDLTIKEMIVQVVSYDPIIIVTDNNLNIVLNIDNTIETKNKLLKPIMNNYRLLKNSYYKLSNAQFKFKIANNKLSILLQCNSFNLISVGLFNNCEHNDNYVIDSLSNEDIRLLYNYVF